MSNPIINDKCFQSRSQFKRKKECNKLGLIIFVKVVKQKVIGRIYKNGVFYVKYDINYQLEVLYKGKKKPFLKPFKEIYHCYYIIQAYDYFFYNFFKLKDKPFYLKGNWWLNGKKVNKPLNK